MRHVVFWLLLGGPLVAARQDAGTVRIPLRYNHVPFVRSGGRSNDLPLSGSDQRYGEYSVNIMLGPQVFTVMLDTGSSDLAVGALGCKGCEVKINRPYDPLHDHSNNFEPATPMGCDWCLSHKTKTTSTSCVDRGGKDKQCVFHMGYADKSSFSAALYNDSFTFADGDTGIAALKMDAIVGAMYTASFPNPKQIDGIFGFGGMQDTTTGAPTPFDILVNSGRIQNVFSICMHPNGIGGHLYLGTDGPSGLTATGEPLPTVIKGTRILDTQWTPLLDGGFYGVGVKDVLVNGKSLKVDPKVYNDGLAIVDSGTQDVCFPATAFHAIKQSFEELCKAKVCMKGVCDCQKHRMLSSPILGGNRCVILTKEQRAVFPMIEVVMEGGVTVQYSPENYLKNGAAYCDDHDNKENMYTMALSYNGPDGSGTIFGESFMQGYLVVHDRQNKRVGFQPVTEQNCPSVIDTVVV